MDRLISVSIIRPIAVIAAVLMIVMFGGVALQSIPIQLTPDVNQPVITITTQWPGAAPAEVERERAPLHLLGADDRVEWDLLLVGDLDLLGEGATSGIELGAQPRLGS